MLGHSGPGSNGNEGVLYIPQSPSISRNSPSDCLVSYPGHLFGGGEVLPLCREAVGVFYSPSWLSKLSSCGCVNSTVWMHNMETYKKQKNLDENHTRNQCYFEQNLETTLHKIAAVKPPTNHLRKHPIKMNKTCQVLLEK